MVTRMDPGQMGAEGLCRATEACGGAEATALSSALVAAGVVAVVAVAVALHVRHAEDAVAEERARTVAERDAFERFARRVADLEVVPPGRTAPAAGAPLGTDDASGPDGGDVTALYRETVMGTDHYGTDYGEPLAENLRIELGTDVASALLDDGALSPPLQQAVVQGTVTARDQREQWLRTLDREADRLAAAREELSAIDRRREAIVAGPDSFADRASDWRRLEDLEDRCSSLLADRQSAIHDGQPVGPRVRDTETVYAYLYDGLEVTYPVLADATALVERVREARDRVLDDLARRA